MTPAVAEAPPAPRRDRRASRRRRQAVVLGGVVVVGALVAALLLTPGPPSERLARFSLPRLGGGPAVAYLPADHGTPVVLTFFGSWCAPCHKDLPVFAKVAEQAERSGTRVRFVGVDGNDYSQAAGEAFARQAGVSFPVAYDENQQVAQSLGLDGMPDTVFVDADGTVAHVIEGDGAGQFSPAIVRHWISVVAATA